ncbi:major facilitator superfamily domain-containing protein 9-like [Ylistrum balloti]|uniref:major facilitator superfamily domain-containing protein 9-like n=1 Tax=Ylistrum balloti TaxID=509963 RepID=UPI002905859A|nr:major facilitator superfamily domain-containing protein 9-like [Ylistrum balloti]
MTWRKCTDPTWAIYTSGFLDFFGVSMVIPLISNHARDLGASPTMAGFIGSVYGCLQLFSSPVVGRWSDMSGRKYCLLWSLFFSACGYMSLGFSTSLIALFLARIPLGIFKHSQSISKSLLADMLPKDKQSAVHGHFNSVSSIGFILGPVVSGHIVEMAGGFYSVTFLCGAIFMLNGVLVWCCFPDVKSKSHDLVRDESSTSLQKLGSDEFNFNPKQIFQFKSLNWSAFWDLFLARFCLGLSLLLFRSNFSLMLREKFEVSPKGLGYVISYSGIISALCGMLAGHISRLYQNDQRLYKHLAILMTLTMVLFVFISTFWWYVLLLIPLSFASMNLRVVGTSILISKGSKQEIGALIGLSQSVMSIARMVAPLLSGVLLEISPSGPPSVGAGMAALAVLVISVKWQRGKEQSRLKQD